MTESKMTKILVDLAQSHDYGVFYLIDAWQTDETKRVRELIKVSDLAEEFKKKEGRFYKQYRLGSDFKELVKHIKKGEEMQIKCFYKDTYEAFIKEWKKNHPDEKDYDSWRKKMKKKDHRKFLEYVGSMGTFNSPYFLKINNNFKF